jgi:ketosteroid isomerase-like protein
MTVDEWVERYRQAWVDADEEAAASLFTDDGVYQWHLLQPASTGHDGVREYWRNVCSTQSEVDVRMGRPFVDGERVAVEFWTRMKNEGQPVTVLGCMLLRFADDGRCEELREYWHFEQGDHEAPALWGK